MIRQISIIAFASILLSSCAVLTVEDVGDGNYYVNGVLADGAIQRAKDFCREKNKTFVAKRIEQADTTGRWPSVFFTCK